MRRLVIEEPVTRPAIWSPRFALFAAAVAGIGVALVRTGQVELAAGFAVLAAALSIAFAALVLAITAFVTIWIDGRRGLVLAVWGFLLSVALLGWPGYLAAKAVYFPQLNDISTDIDDPPAFSRSREAQKERGDRALPDVSPVMRALQRDAYPRVTPLFLELEPEDVFDAVRRAADELGWKVLDSAKPGGRTGIGRLDAVHRTFLFGFADDITVRIKPRAAGTRVDVRSVSRIGRHDFGTNAERIVKFLEEVYAQATTR
jgi:uncharacterized protein (DUF1499 family)